MNLAELLAKLPLPADRRPTTDRLTLAELVELLTLGGQGTETVWIGLGAEVTATAPSFGARLRGLRLAKGWTQPQLATAAGIPKQSIVEYETGRRSPSLKAAEKLSSALELDLNAFAGTSWGESAD